LEGTQVIDIRVGKAVRQVILLSRDETDGITPTTLYRKSKRKKKKGSRGVRELDKMVKAATQSQQTFADTLLKRRKRSNRKRKDGWLRDLGQNVFKASGKSWRKLMKGAGM
jgi:hypothetical protein